MGGVAVYAGTGIGRPNLKPRPQDKSGAVPDPLPEIRISGRIVRKAEVIEGAAVTALDNGGCRYMVSAKGAALDALIVFGAGTRVEVRGTLSLVKTAAGVQAVIEVGTVVPFALR